MQKQFETGKMLMDSYFRALTASPLDESAFESAQQAIVSQRQTDMERMFDLDRSIIKVLTTDELALLATCLASDISQKSTTSTVAAK